MPVGSLRSRASKGANPEHQLHRPNGQLLWVGSRVWLTARAGQGSESGGKLAASLDGRAALTGSGLRTRSGKSWQRIRVVAAYVEKF